jgi:trans-aconitate methyltransferase
MSLKNKFVDWGCALGQGCKYFLNEITDNKKIIGVDVSEKATQQAKVYYPKYTFLNSLDEIKEPVDCIYTSNTLEHFYDPAIEFKKLIDKTNKYLIMLVPFRQEPTQFHFYKFAPEFFDKMRVLHNLLILQFTVIGEIDQHYSPTSQVLCVYRKKEFKL